MSLLDRVFDTFQFVAQVRGKVDDLTEELAGLGRDVRQLEMRVMRVETIVEILRGERLPPLPRLEPPTS
jgi:hypothetical protein